MSQQEIIKSNKLDTYFKTFSKNDWLQFALFLKSPFFNTSPTIFRLYEFFKSRKLNGWPEEAWKQEAFSYVYPKTDYKDGQLRTLFWRMTKLIENYLAITILQADKAVMDDHLIQALGKRNEWFELFERKIALKSGKEKQSSLELTTLLQSVKLHHQLYFHEDFGKYRSGYLEIQQLVEDLDKFIILAKLKYHCELIARKQILEEGERPSLLSDKVLDEILVSAESQNAEPVFFIYAKLIRVIQKEDLKLYFAAKLFFQKKVKHINPEDRQNILFHLINFIIHKNRQHDNPLYDEMLSLYQFGLESGILILHDRITYRTFTNIAVLGSAQKRFVWTDSFIKKYQGKLEPAKAGLAVKLSRAFWNFHQGAYEKVLDWTVEIEVQEGQPDYPFRLMALKLRAFYELYLQDKSYRRLLYSFIDSFTRFIKNNRKLARPQASAYLNFIRVMKLLLIHQERDRFDGKRKQKMINKIMLMNPLILKSWLLEKVDKF